MIQYGEVVENTNMYICTVNNLEMRVGPSKDFSSIGKMKKGDFMNVKYEVNGWISDGNIWVYKGYMKKYTDDQTWKGTTMVNLNARKGPGTSYGKVTMIPKGTKVTILKEENNWFQVKYKGMKVWVSGMYLK